jgi:hypothetical protein
MPLRNFASLSVEPLVFGFPGGPRAAFVLGEFEDLVVQLSKLFLQGVGIAFSFPLAGEGDLELVTDPSYPVLMRMRGFQSAQLQPFQVLAYGSGDRLAVVGLDG